MKNTPKRLTAGLTDGSELPSGSGTMKIELREVAKLVVGTGCVMACDAGENFPARSLDRRMYPGAHSVKLSLVHLPNGEVRCGFATIWVLDNPPVKWKQARFVEAYPGAKWSDPNWNNRDEWQTGSTRRVSIDSGACCFMDVQVGWMIGYGNEPFWDRAARAFQKLGRGGWCAGALLVDKRFGLNVVGFSSGWGDGGYPLYWGLDKEGEVCRLTVDFGLLDEAE